ncbi:MAG: isoprenylcysteine carboxylmethyltransferase family protein [Thaumarchaeota archaeon]|nr:isoprenylcysteine carboxylmethyltransferase family protein [Nitrososphaerota archaeon]
MSLLHPAIELAVFYVVFGLWLLITFIVEPLIIGRGGRRERRTQEDRGSALLIFIGTFAAIVVAFSLGGANVTLLPDWTFLVGITLMFVGIVIREWAIMTLREFFLFRVGVLKDHKVVDSGPYKLVRHPGYGGAIATFVGIGFATQSLVGVLVLFVISGVVYGYRIVVEERALVRDLDGPYSEYMRRTKRLIPFLL